MSEEDKLVVMANKIIIFINKELHTARPSEITVALAMVHTHIINESAFNKDLAIARVLLSATVSSMLSELSERGWK